MSTSAKSQAIHTTTTAPASQLPPAKLKEFGLWLLRRRNRYQVSGSSMSPLLKSGQFVFAKKPTQLKIGGIVIAHHPYQKIAIIKQISHISTTGKITLTSLNKTAGTDSSTFGPIEKKNILGILTSIIS